MGYIRAKEILPAEIIELILFMAWLLSIFMERCKCMFMGISSVSSFYPVAPKIVKCRKNGVKNGVCLLAVYQEF
ncbi:MAG: hypothetical protein HFH49_14245 [Lachnospiraceae bacterium]|nr:hypothetical protein [Lachnospiraceae bacterium]